MECIPDRENLKKNICLFVLTESMNVTGRQTDKQTPHDDIGRTDA